jgi:hypothetical protein
MKQTAVDWLVEKLKENGVNFWQEEIEMIEEAKEMEKQQMLGFYHEGSFAYMRYFDGKEYVKAEQYYNETFKSE